MESAVFELFRKEVLSEVKWKQEKNIQQISKKRL